MSLRDEILARYAPAIRKVDALNGLDIHAKALSGADWFDLRACKSDADSMVLAVIRGACDAQGNRIFGDDDMEKVRGLSRDFTIPVSDAILALSGLSGDDSGKADSTPAGSSPSG